MSGWASSSAALAGFMEPPYWMVMERAMRAPYRWRTVVRMKVQTSAACSAVCYIITGLAQAVLGSRASLVTSLVLLVVAIVLELAVLSVIRARTRAKTSGDAV